MDYDYKIKLILIGEGGITHSPQEWPHPGVGKSSLIMKYTEDSFTPSYSATLGHEHHHTTITITINNTPITLNRSVDFQSKAIVVDGKRIMLNIWDTAGHDNTHHTTPHTTHHPTPTHADAIPHRQEAFHSITKGMALTQHPTQHSDTTIHHSPSPQHSTATHTASSWCTTSRRNAPLMVLYNGGCVVNEWWEWEW